MTGKQLLKKSYYSIAFVIFIFSLIFLSACSREHKQPKLRLLSANDVILAFGDSLTYGVGAPPGASYPEDLEIMIGLQVINAGVPGEETRDGVDRIQQELDKINPKLVIVCLGGNDLIRKRSHADIKENLKKIIQIIQQSGAQVMLIAVPEPSLSLSPPDFYQELGKELRIPVDDKTIPRLFKISEYKSDYIHFNAMGYRAFAEGIADFLRKQGALPEKH